MGEPHAWLSRWWRFRSPPAQHAAPARGVIGLISPRATQQQRAASAAPPAPRPFAAAPPVLSGSAPPRCGSLSRAAACSFRSRCGQPGRSAGRAPTAATRPRSAPPRRCRSPNCPAQCRVTRRRPVAAAAARGAGVQFVAGCPAPGWGWGAGSSPGGGRPAPCCARCMLCPQPPRTRAPPGACCTPAAAGPRHSFTSIRELGGQGAQVSTSRPTVRDGRLFLFRLLAGFLAVPLRLVLLRPIAACGDDPARQLAQLRRVARLHSKARRGPVKQAAEGAVRRVGKKA